MADGEDLPPTLPPPAPVDLGPIGPTTRYEFTPEQDRVIADLGGKMGFVGAFLVALSLLFFLRVFVLLWTTRNTPPRFAFDWASALNGLLYGCVGVWTMRASGAFTAVAATVGRDITHLMSALAALRKMYSLLYWLLVMAIVAYLILALSTSFRGA